MDKFLKGSAGFYLIVMSASEVVCLAWLYRLFKKLSKPMDIMIDGMEKIVEDETKDRTDKTE